MEKTSNVKQLDFRKAVVDVRRNRKSLLLIFVTEAAHVPNHLQGMSIHGVDVKQVELHLPNHAFKFGQIGT